MSLTREPCGIDDSENETPRNRINLQFFFAWIAGTALYSTIFLVHKSPEFTDWVGVVEVTVILVICTVYGANLAAWIFVVKRLFHAATPFPSQAGHWLCLLTPTLELAIAGEGQKNGTGPICDDRGEARGPGLFGED